MKRRKRRKRMKGMRSGRWQSVEGSLLGLPLAMMTRPWSWVGRPG
jgi:hypothetical protein